MADINVSNLQVCQLVRRMTDRKVPLCFWTGYTSVVLVSPMYLRNWGVVVSESPMMRILPRRWYDIGGIKIVDIWQAGLRAVMGLIFFRPGIAQVRQSAILFHTDFSLEHIRANFVGVYVPCMTGKKWVILPGTCKRKA